MSEHAVTDHEPAPVVCFGCGDTEELEVMKLTDVTPAGEEPRLRHRCPDCRGEADA